MRSFRNHLALALASAGILAGASARSEAGMITYSETVEATGSLGGSTFTNALLTLTFVGDTANVTSPSAGIYRNSTGTATVTVGGTKATLAGPIDVFVTQADHTVGIETYARILTVSNAAFSGYDLTSAIGPLTGAAAGFSGPFDTSGGALTITTLAGTASFGAAASAAVPEPSSLALLGVGLAGMVVALRRRAAR